MQRMSAIATKTKEYVVLVEGTNTTILDTRKTTPGIRILEKWAVRIGGGANHRFGLYDMIMLKDNHLDYAGGITQAIKKTLSYLKEKNLDLKIEVEARDLDEVKEIMKTGGIHRIMLDNFTPSETIVAVQLINKTYETESSGGITDQTIRSYAECGVDFISVGALTHSIYNMDMSLKAF
jgi:nicotinate-nucleotide pyrophosphorylase (carboxylating)